jgi:hypothetical protein
VTRALVNKMKKIQIKESRCMYCQNKINFDLPNHLLDDLLQGDVAIFAGSGISTETKYVLPDTLFDSIAADLGYKKRLHKSFPEIMEEYCSQPNGRIKLLSEIKRRFDNIGSFPGLYSNATRFHRELATLPQIKTIITTNWDTYFEDECGAIPFINSEDFAFWDTDTRKVLKIHGSINKLGSLIATTEDYKKSLKELHKGLLGSFLKSILATKTIIYIGYSFSDEDFKQIHSFINKEMKGLSRQAYIVTLDKANLAKFRELNLIPIVTDGTHFISVVKDHSVHKHRTLPDVLYGYAYYMHGIVIQAYNKLYKEYDVEKYPEIIYCGFYQDGLAHAYERIMALRNTGRYSCSCEFTNTVELYKKYVKEFRGKKRYQDVAYIEGYLYAHMQLLFLIEFPDIKFPLPLYYAYGYGQILNFNEYKKLIKKLPTFHKSANRMVQRIVKRMSKGEKIVFHHPAHL